MADTTRDIELRLRARDLSTAELKAVVASVRELSGALDQQLAAATRLEIKEKELRSTLQQFDQAAKNVAGIDALIQRSKVLSQQLEINRQDIGKAEEALKSHRAAMEAGTATGKAAETALAGFERALAAAQKRLETNTNSLTRHNASLEQAGVDTRDLAAAEQQLIATADAIGNSRTRLTQTIQKYARLEREAKEAAAASAKASRETAEALKVETAARVEATNAVRGQAVAALQEFNKRQEDNRQRVADLQKFNEETKRLAAERVAQSREADRQALRQVGLDANARIAAQERTHATLSRDLDKFNEETRRRRRENAEAERRDIRERGRDAIRQTEINERGIFQRVAIRIRAEREAREDIRKEEAAKEARRTDSMGRPGRGAAQTPGFLGLRPYELTNLGYQVNDVISGFASGQNATQILAQQGGQFIQIFGTAALRWFPLVAVAVTGVAVAIQALTSNLRILASNREFTALMTANKYAADQNVESLTRLRRELQDVGVSWDDAGKAIRAALEGNVRADRMQEFLTTARAMARVSGVEVPQATQDLVAGIQGGVAAFDQLLAKYPAIDSENAKYIRGLLAAGETAKAQTEIIRLLGEAYGKAQEQKLSPFEKQVERLRTAWNRMIERLGESQAFDTLITKLTSFVEWLTKAVEATDKFIKNFDGSKFQQVMGYVETYLKVVTFPTRMAAAGVGAAAGAVGDYFSRPEGGTGRFSTGSLKTDSEELKTLVAILSDATRALPPGYRAEAISTQRPGATVRGTGQPSEHAHGRAIDVRIVDAQGNPVPGYMGAGGPMYDILDKAVAAMAAARGIPIAIGSTFSNKDAGHYSIGGREAATTAGRLTPGGALAPRGVPAPGITGGPTATQEGAASAAVQAAQRQLDLARASSRAEEERVKREEIRLRLVNEGIHESQRQGIIDKEIAVFRESKDREEYARKQDLAKQREQDRRDTLDIAAIEKGGADAVAAAIKAGRTNYEELYQIRMKGEADARAELQRRRQELDQIDAAQKQIDDRRRGMLREQKSELDNLNEATNLYYDNQLKALEKLSERQTTTDKARLDSLKAQTEELRKQELIDNERKAALATANTALATRRDLISTYTKLEQAGEISITEREERIKEAYDATRESINGAADALQKYLDQYKDTLPEVQVAKLKAQIMDLRSETKYVDPFFKGMRDTFSQSFTSGIDTAFNTIGEAIGGAIAKTKEWKDVFTSVKQAGAQLFAQLLRDIASYIIKAQAAKIASSLFSGPGGGAGGGFLSFLGLGSQTAATGAGGASIPLSATGGLFHEGGVVGRGTRATRTMPESWWAGAPRYHDGTVVGLAPGEQRAILMKNEEVLSADNPRNILNGGGQRPVYVRNVLVDDQRKVPEAMQGAEGEKVIVQTVIRNGATIRQLARG